MAGVLEGMVEWDRIWSEWEGNGWSYRGYGGVG
jgi:hypothetical protein